MLLWPLGEDAHGEKFKCGGTGEKGFFPANAALSAHCRAGSLISFLRTTVLKNV